MTSKYFKTQKDALRGSFKSINKGILFVLLYDILFYLGIFLAGFMFVNALESRSNTVDLNQDILGLGLDSAQQMLSSVKGFFFFLIFLTIAFLLFIIINWSIFKGLIWATISKRKIEKDMMINFLKLNLVWMGCWILIFVFIIFSFQDLAAAILIIIGILLFLYFSVILYTFYMRKPKKGLIKKALGFGFTKFHYYLLPLILVGIALTFLNTLMSYLYIPNLLTYSITLVFLAWIRYYLHSLTVSI